MELNLRRWILAENLNKILKSPGHRNNITEKRIM